MGVERRKTLEFALLVVAVLTGTERVSCVHPAELVIERFWNDFGKSLGLPCGEKCAFVTDSTIRTPAAHVPCELATRNEQECTLQQNVVFVAFQGGDHVHRLFLQPPFQRLKNSRQLRYVINCAPFSRLRKEFSRSYLERTQQLRVFNNVTWGAVTYYSRKESLLALLRPLSKMRDESGEQYVKTRAISYSFMNEGTGKGTELRYHFLNLLKRFENQVETPRALRRANPLMLDEAVAAYSPYLFNLAWENIDTPGYISEKVLNAFLAGCIPIYWGTDDVMQYFNPKAMIAVKQFPSWREAARHVADVYSNKTLQDEYLREAPMTPEGLRKLFWYHDFGPNQTLNQVAEEESRGPARKAFWPFG